MQLLFSNSFGGNLPKDLDLSQTLDLFGLLTQTISRYSDSASQDAVEAIGMELVKRDEMRGISPDVRKLGVTELINGWLVNEVGRIYKPGLSRSGNDLVCLSSTTNR